MRPDCEYPLQLHRRTLSREEQVPLAPPSKFSHLSPCHRQHPDGIHRRLSPDPFSSFLTGVPLLPLLSFTALNQYSPEKGPEVLPLLSPSPAMTSRPTWSKCARKEGPTDLVRGSLYPSDRTLTNSIDQPNPSVFLKQAGLRTSSPAWKARPPDTFPARSSTVFTTSMDLPWKCYLKSQRLTDPDISWFLSLPCRSSFIYHCLTYLILYLSTRLLSMSLTEMKASDAELFTC